MKKIMVLPVLLLLILTQAYAQDNKILGKNRNTKHLVYTIDGVKQSSDVPFSLSNFDPESIENFKILSKENALALFGPEAIDGAILLTTKAGKNTASNIALDNKLSALNLEKGVTQLANVPYQSSQDLVKGNAVVTLRGSNIFTGIKDIKDVLYILDGKEIEKSSMKFVNPETIQSITVLKTDEALAKYGAKGRNGAVIISSKIAKIQAKETTINRQ